MFYDVYTVLVEYHKHIIKINMHMVECMLFFIVTDGVYYKKVWRLRD